MPQKLMPEEEKELDALFDKALLFLWKSWFEERGYTAEMRVAPRKPGEPAIVCVDGSTDFNSRPCVRGDRSAGRQPEQNKENITASIAEKKGNIK